MGVCGACSADAKHCATSGNSARDTVVGRQVAELREELRTLRVQDAFDIGRVPSGKPTPPAGTCLLDAGDDGEGAGHPRRGHHRRKGRLPAHRAHQHPTAGDEVIGGSRERVTAGCAQCDCPGAAALTALATPSGAAPFDVPVRP